MSRKIKVMTTKGKLEVEALHVWSQQILGAQFTFALHPAGVVARGFDVPLAISELSTGFDTKAVLLHPKNRTVLSMHSARNMPNKELKSRARAALHGLLKRVGQDRFVKAALMARIQVEHAKATAGEESASFFMPGAARLAPACGVCQDSKVVSTTDKDHEGNNIEITCPACIPQPAGFNAKLEAVQAEAEEPVEEIAAAKAAGKCGECYVCYAGYHEQCKGKDFDWGKELGVDEALADAEVMNDNMRKYGTIDEPSLEKLHDRRNYLLERTDQHSTMTGDTTEQEYEALTEELEEIETKIANLESKP